MSEMNREMRRRARKQGLADEEGSPVATRREAPTPPPKGDRSSPGAFMREVRGELRRVNWPTRNEVVNYSIVVLITVVILTSFIGGLDYGFAESILRLFTSN